jgi:CheY-like chemotaxis protein
MDGEEFVGAIRQLDGLASIPIIVVSASRSGAQIGQRLGAAVALSKPFDLLDLIERVNDQLR